MSYNIEFLLYPNILGLDVMGPLEVFDTASLVIKQSQPDNFGYKSHFVAEHKGAIPLSSGLSVVAEYDFQHAPPADILIIPGGHDTQQTLDNPTFMNYVRRRATQVKRVVSICRGAFILAALGLLDGKQATTHWHEAKELAKTYPNVSVNADAIFIQDGRIYTGAGVTSGIDLALAIVKDDFGASAAIAVSRILVLYFRRPGFQSQFSAPLQAQELAGSQFAKLHDWLIDNLKKTITVEQMAEYLAMSTRHFSRIFKTETGTTPHKYLEILRLDRAREMMIAGHEALTTIATESGFGREEQLRRAFLRRFGVTPSQYRLHFIQTNR